MRENCWSRDTTKITRFLQLFKNKHLTKFSKNPSCNRVYMKINCKSESPVICRFSFKSTELFSTEFQENSRVQGKYAFLEVFQSSGKKLQNSTSFPAFPGVAGTMAITRNVRMVWRDKCLPKLELTSRI